MEREGTLSIRVVYRANGEPEYAIGFADYREPGGAMKVRRIIGSGALERFLKKDVDVQQPTVTSALDGLEKKGGASIFNVILSEDKLASLDLR